MAEQKRVLTRVHTRKIDRRIAKNAMKKEGIQNFCKHSYTHSIQLSGKNGETFRHDSYFAEHWREYV